MNDNNKKYRRSALSIVCYVLAALMLVYIIYMTIAAFRGRQFHNNPNETFIKALLFWDENREGS